MRGWVCGLIPGQLSFHTEAMESSCILPLERPDTIEALLDIMGSTASVFFLQKTGSCVSNSIY